MVVLVAVMAIVAPAHAQSAKEIRKERQEMSKMTKSELNSKASKAARKEAKKLTKDGWQVTPGSLPLDKQLDRSYNLQYEFDENLLPKYIMGEAMSIGETYDAAKMQAMELAKQNLAGQIATEVTALVENTVSNQQLTAEQAASIVQTVTASKNLISQSIGRVVPVVEVYRVKGNKNKEVLVRIAYSTDMAMQAAKKVILEELEKKGEDLHDQLDNIMGVK
ncbi:MAG: hypothetical protein J6X88_03640 [Bacteroidales bacterium]|nr:hypothetical protein [Bacteroidales bacterium]